jgi:queuine tRNA-ribosyltransferase
VSFENDLDALRLALYYPDLFKHLRHAAPNEILEHGSWTSPDGRLQWTLFEGDFLQTLEKAPSPHIIYYDPFSDKTDVPLWKAECFERLLARIGEGAARLFTYSASTAVRATLLSSGFFVATGRETGPKAETTVALSPAARGEYPLLGADWLDRYHRSSAREGLGPELERRVLAHPQWSQPTS